MAPTNAPPPPSTPQTLFCRHFYYRGFKVCSFYQCTLVNYLPSYCHSECSAALGMENYKIKNSHCSASSQYGNYYAPNQGRLNFKISGSYNGGWSAGANDLNQWFQVDLGIETDVTYVATQGRNQRSQWVTKYKLLYGNDGISFVAFR